SPHSSLARSSPRRSASDVRCGSISWPRSARPRPAAITRCALPSACRRRWWTRRDASSSGTAGTSAIDCCSCIPGQGEQESDGRRWASRPCSSASRRYRRSRASLLRGRRVSPPSRRPPSTRARARAGPPRRPPGPRSPPVPLLAGTLTHVAGYLGNDSGISHLAAATGTPAAVLFGAERLIWRPWALHVEPLVVSLAAEEESDIERVASAVTALLR